MITVQLNKRDFEYDIHSLIRAFYPGVDVPLYLEGEEEPQGFEKKLEVCYSEALIRLIWRDADGKELARRECAVDFYADRKQTKNALKAALYELLSEYTGQKLPWGNLTGIRPTKIPMGLLEQGWKNTEIADYMRKTYYTSNEKTALAISIANRERAILKDIDYQNGYSLYVGIPFCPSICLYCSFSSSPLSVWKSRVDDYLDALCREIEQTAHIWREKQLDTVYIGGGTPTTLEPYQLERLLDKLEECFELAHVKEFTVEAGRPDSITAKKLQVLKDHPVTRISINPQTMNDRTLEIIGRRHTVQQTTEAFALARRIGFDNINMDLIVGLPGEGYAEVEHTMRQVTALAPDSITVHSLALKRATRLNLFKDQYAPMSFVNNQEIMDMTARYAAQAGQFPYYLYRQKNMAGNFENVGYAREGAAGIYNILIMEEKQSILALGAGASTKLVDGERIERVENVKDIRSYIERIDEMIDRKIKAL
ncbi:MAG: coproporphyrinogen dehydrogenase HemZ [Marvinbryantia sp.]|uniref:coproporphyrinogen dehydrogenase HemZ n=1 Tax=Marvinbryantia sp. TaxID=2496532 RepID=UPI0025FCD6A0|nr:coproporphyrinogen dehydrogenase HemZ [uncultured Marvinbryantia sp.]